MYPYYLNLPGNQNLCKQLLARGIFIFVIRPHFSFVRFRYTWKNFKVRLSEKIKIKIEPEPKLCEIIKILQTSFLSNVCRSDWRSILVQDINYFTMIHWRIQGAPPACTPTTGSNSFIFTYIFAEKHPRRRSAPLQWLGTPPPPTGNPGSAIVIIILMDIT